MDDINNTYHVTNNICPTGCGIEYELCLTFLILIFFFKNTSVLIFFFGKFRWQNERH